MTAQDRPSCSGFTGRIASGPDGLLREEILDPQFSYEIRYLLPGYIAIEKVLATEYVRMGLMTQGEAEDIAAVLQSADGAALDELRPQGMSDVAFTLERYIDQRLPGPVPRWHVDRSRNDLQACAQLLFGRDQLSAAGGTLVEFGIAAHHLAEGCTEVMMPGYTHFQAAQIISPGFYFTALSEQVLHCVRRLLMTYDAMDACPLGSGAMAGQQLAWDRKRMAHLLGFRDPEPLALTGVASRTWVLEITAELSILGTVLSRFCTDLLAWTGSEFGFFDLPDELSGISSAMPQKKNFPVLERIRGRTAHLAALHMDAVLGQRNTPYTNLVEVSKEAGANLLTAFTTIQSTLKLFGAVLGRLIIRSEHTAAACERDFFGGFSLANRLTLDEGVPWRRAQVIAGEYIVSAMRAGDAPGDWDGELLRRVAGEHGFTLRDPNRALEWAFDITRSQEHMVSAGSTRPEEVRAILSTQASEYERISKEWADRAQVRSSAAVRLDRLLGL